MIRFASFFIVLETLSSLCSQNF